MSQSHPEHPRTRPAPTGRCNRWLLAGCVALTGAFTAVAARPSPAGRVKRAAPQPRTGTQDGAANPPARRPIEAPRGCTAPTTHHRSPAKNRAPNRAQERNAESATRLHAPSEGPTEKPTEAENRAVGSRKRGGSRDTREAEHESRNPAPECSDRLSREDREPSRPHAMTSSARAELGGARHERAVLRLASDPRRACTSAEAIVGGKLDAIDRACSRFRADSDLSARERRRGAGRAASSRLLIEALEVALRAAELTDGDVDPTRRQRARARGL